VASTGELLTTGLLFSALSYAGAVALLLAQNLRGLTHPWMASLSIYGISALATWSLTGLGWELALPLALALVTAAAAVQLLRNFTAPGQLFMATFVELILFGFPWGLWFISTIPVSPLTRVLMFAGFPLLVVMLPSGLVQMFETLEVLCRRTWTRPREPLPPTPRGDYPMVALHVPVYSEPPEMVISTLDALARLRYPNFEVLVVDNNTKDPGLWHPVEAHCQRLGPRFRFFHVDSLPGAKAGALNFALRHTSPEAELISVVDSDYHAQPDFLERLVGYFDDPRMGFVQTPHDYREWDRGRYLKMCYWEYRYFFKTMLVSRNERVAAITVGTMCLIRRSALEAAGGWAEWCVTEDSELAIRIHALGYSSVYLTETFGRGLIPETFSGYKSQRFRWTYGPVQELKHHLPLLLPRPLGTPSDLSPAQKVHHLNHGLDRLNVGLGFLLAPVGIALATSMLIQREVVRVPLALWLAATVLLTTGFALRWVTYRAVIGSTSGEALGALLASKALSHTITMASLRGLFTASMPWRRTNKFKSSPAGLSVLRSARSELLLGLAILLFVVAAIAVLPRHGLLLMLLIGVAFQSFRYLSAPAVALLAERDLRAQA
jgi:hypothetical protein